MRVIEILSDLVKIDTMNPNGNEKRITDYIKEKFSGYENIFSINNGENRESLVIDIKGNSEETIGLIGHIDTVPVTNPEEWIYPPLSATVVDDQMYGRGTSDMKSGAACMINLGLHYIENNIKPNKNIRLIFTADEESSGLGISSVLKEGLIEDLDFIIVPENTSSKVVIKEKGALWIELEVFGKSAHGARPDLGINSIEIVYSIYEDIKEFIKISKKDEYLDYTTVSLNTISGGEKVNIIADYCKGELDIRANPDLENKVIVEFIDKKIEEYTSKYKDLKINRKILTDRISFDVDVKNSFVSGFIKKLEENKMETELAGVRYFTDLSLTQPVVNKPFVIFGPGYIDKGHQKNEHVSIKETSKVSEFYIEYFK